jgi:2-polyprenyl-3-methyl-5-hydroxy-6-metoxy-1,4-benzoquinol methylase
MCKTYSSVPGDERTERVPCPLCGTGGGSLFFQGDGFTFVRCRSCALIYQDPRPIMTDLRVRYDHEYFLYERANEAAFLRLMLLGLRDIGFDAAAESLPRPSRFLDIGCATGMLLEEMKARGWDTQGVDVCAESAEYGKRERDVEIFAGTLEEARFPAESFSVAHFSHLIEHVTDPRGFLSEVRRVLMPAGIAVITTPNTDGLQARIFRGKWRSVIADHLALFDRKNLARLLSETGFSSNRTITWGGLAAGLAPGFIKWPMDRLAKRWGFGDVMLVAARKN